MNDLFLFRSDLFPFPGTGGIEYLALLFWRTQVWIAGGFLLLLGMDRLTEGCRGRGRNWLARLLPGMILLGGVLGIPLALWPLYRIAPLCSYIIQWNTRFAVAEIALASVALLVLAWLAHRAVKRSLGPGIRSVAWRSLFWMVALVGCALGVASLWWRRPDYRPVPVAIAEFVLSLGVATLLLALLAPRAWRRGGWKSLVPKVAWLAALLYTAAGWIAWFGVAKLVANSCG